MKRTQLAFILMVSLIVQRSAFGQYELCGCYPSRDFCYGVCVPAVYTAEQDSIENTLNACLDDDEYEYEQCISEGVDPDCGAHKQDADNGCYSAYYADTAQNAYDAYNAYQDCLACP